MLEEVLVPIVAMLATFGIPGALIWQHLTTKHKERMTIIERGMDPAMYRSMFQKNTTAPNPLRSMKWALLGVFGGTGLWVGSWLVQVFRFPEEVIFASTLIGGGVGLFIYYLVAMRAERDKKQAPAA